MTTIAGWEVGRLGIGGLGFAVANRPAIEVALATVRHALEQGILLFDTANCYGRDGFDQGYSENLLNHAFVTGGVKPGRDVLLTTKGGMYRSREGDWHTDGRPEHVLAACEGSLSRFRVDSFFLYQFHRPDPGVPFLETLGAFQTLREQGKIQHIGVSNVTMDQLESAVRVTEIASVQNAFSPFATESREQLEFCEAHNIAFLPWAPLGSARRVEVWNVLQGLADEMGISVPSLLLAWHVAQSPVSIPIPGITEPFMVDEAILGITTNIDPATVLQIERAIDETGASGAFPAERAT